MTRIAPSLAVSILLATPAQAGPASCDAVRWESLLPVIVGGLIGIAGGVLLDFSRRRADARSIRRAIAGEISALLSIVEQRGYVAELQKSITGRLPFTFSLRGDPFPVYHSNVANIGTLRGDLPRQIAVFYVQAMAILEDVADIDSGKAGEGEELQRRQEDLLRVFLSAIPLGERIVKEASA